MSFNYRIMKRSHDDGTIEYAIHEVYYDSVDGDVIAWSERPIEPYGQTLEEIKDDLRMMSAALTKPVLDMDELEKKFDKLTGSSSHEKDT